MNRRALVAVLTAGVAIVVVSASLLDLLARSALRGPVALGDVEPLSGLDNADLAQGQRLYNTVLNCGECHAADGSGVVVIQDGFMGTVAGPNLTTLDFDPGQWDLAIRHGVVDGRPLILMPSDGYAALSDTDLRDVVSYIQQLERVDTAVPQTQLAVGGRQLAYWGMFHVPAWTISHQSVGAAAPSRDEGSYLAQVSGCHGCHGEQLQGKSLGPSQPPAPAIDAAAMVEWTRDEFSDAVRKGQGRDGRSLDTIMPWPALSGLTDAELDLLWEHSRNYRLQAP